MNLTQSIKEQIILLAAFAGRDMNQMLLDGYMKAIADLDHESVFRALCDWLKTSKGFPHPSDIREKVKPEINPADDAQLVANLILAAIGKHGHTNADRAKTMIGDLAWETVKLMGGWKHLCEVIDNENEGMYRAQMRGLAETVRRKSMRGELHLAPALPSPHGEAVHGLISQTMKGIGDA